MPKFVIAYLGGKQTANPQERAAQMARTSHLRGFSIF